MAIRDSSEAHDGLCGAKTRDGSPCTQRAGWGTDHVGIGYCKLHGGDSPNGQKYAVKVQARMDVERLGARRDIHPAEALLESVQFKAGEVAVWRHKVTQLEDDELTWGVTKVVEGFSPEQGGMVNATTREAKPHIFLAQLHEAEKTLVDMATAALRAGADAALVRVAQNSANVWLEVMRSTLADPRVTVVGDPDDVLFDALKALQGAR
jgi:hypothetical protein